MPAFKAAFADWKLIKTRSCVQIIFEIPLSDEGAAYQILGGMPDPASERWFAIARLDTGVPAPVREAEGHTDPAPASRPRKPVAPEKRLAQQAGILCADPVFQQFLIEQNFINEKTEERAANFVRIYCDIGSRSEITPGSEGANRWNLLHGSFLAWKLAA